jgi:hypothetical protein
MAATACAMVSGFDEERLAAIMTIHVKAELAGLAGSASVRAAMSPHLEG